jgi:hypothetical protein
MFSWPKKRFHVLQFEPSFFAPGAHRMPKTVPADIRQTNFSCNRFDVILEQLPGPEWTLAFGERRGEDPIVRSAVQRLRVRSAKQFPQLLRERKIGAGSFGLERCDSSLNETTAEGNNTFVQVQILPLQTESFADAWDRGGVCNEKQLLPDFFGSTVRNGIDQCVQDAVPSDAVRDFFVPVQARDHVSGRIEVVQNWMASGKCLEVGSGCLCV